jgi:hypothetical protein
MNGRASEDYCHHCRRWVSAGHSGSYGYADPGILVCPNCRKVLFEAEVRAKRRLDRVEKGGKNGAQES